MNTIDVSFSADDGALTFIIRSKRLTTPVRGDDALKCCPFLHSLPDLFDPSYLNKPGCPLTPDYYEKCDFLPSSWNSAELLSQLLRRVETS